MEENPTAVKLGFMFSYFLFTTILYFVFMLLGKLGSLNYIHFMVITFLILTVGVIVQEMLK